VKTTNNKQLPEESNYSSDICTWCLKAKTTAKLNSTEMEFWRCSARISRKDKIRNNVIKQKMNVTSSLLDDVKKKHLQRYGQSKGWRRGDCQKGYWNGDRQGEGNEADRNLPGRRGLEE
jgi:hypothetical protein